MKKVYRPIPVGETMVRLPAERQARWYGLELQMTDAELALVLDEHRARQ